MKHCTFPEIGDMSSIDRIDQLTTQLCDELLIACKNGEVPVLEHALKILFEFSAFEIAKRSPESGLQIISMAEFIQGELSNLRKKSEDLH